MPEVLLIICDSVVAPFVGGFVLKKNPKPKEGFIESSLKIARCGIINFLRKEIEAGSMCSTILPQQGALQCRHILQHGTHRKEEEFLCISYNQLRVNSFPTSHLGNMEFRSG